MNRLLTCGLLALVALTATSARAAQKLAPSQSEVAFVSKQMGVPIEGKFDRFDAEFDIDPKKPEAGKIAFRVELGSASLGNDETDRELKKPGWFDSSRFPVATFQSSAIKSLGDGKLDVAGKLSIKGTTRDIHVPVTLTQQKGQLRANAEFTVKRLDFKIGDGEWGDTGLVANEVIVKLRLAIQGSPGA